MRVGIISDTHSYLDPQVFDHFSECDEIWHAGDFGTIEVANQLEEFKPFRGVYGNIDDERLRNAYQEDIRFRCEHSDVWITHIGGRPGRYDKRIRKLLADSPPRLFICGHSHILQVEQDKMHNGMIYLNPGTAGHHGFHLMRTIVTLDFVADQIGNLNIIELGPRGRKIKNTAS